jgi:hypothetical protein
MLGTLEAVDNKLTEITATFCGLLKIREALVVSIEGVTGETARHKLFFCKTNQVID